MIEDKDHRPLHSKRKAVTTLLPYAVQQESGGQPEMLNAILQAAGASGRPKFLWYHAVQFTSTLFSEASPRTVILASPHIPWERVTDEGSLIQRWVATISTVPHTKEVVQGVVVTLLQIASQDRLVQYIPADLWSWLTKRPSLPPICSGRSIGTHPHAIKRVRALKDAEILKSYLLLVWSEWDGLLLPSSVDEMCTLIWRDFGGIRMGHHRTDLVERLDHVLGQLDRGSEYFIQHDPEFDEVILQERKGQYHKLKETLLNIDAIYRTPYLTILLLCILTPIPGVHRIPQGVYVHTPFPSSVVSRLERSEGAHRDRQR